MSAVETPKKEDYWVVRAAIQKASAEKNDEVLTALASLHPEIFRNVVNFVRKRTK